MLETVDVNLVLQRLADILKTGSSDRQLSKALGLSLSAIDANRKKETLPYKAIVKTCKERGISLDSLFDIHAESSPGTNNKKTRANTPSQTNSQDNLKVAQQQAEKALKIVEGVMQSELYALNIPADAKLEAANKLRPLLINACFEHDFSVGMVEMMAKGAVSMFR